MATLTGSYTSTGEKLFWHTEAMGKLRNDQGMPITAWIAPTDLCNAKCSFCSVGERPGDTLPFSVVKGFIDQLAPLGMKGVIFSGGGNFLLYKCKETGKDCNDVIDYVHSLGIESALITNGMPLVNWAQCMNAQTGELEWTRHPVGMSGRMSWKTMSPGTLDKLTWCRISMAGLDHNHKEQEVFVPDIDPTKTSLGFSWIMSDSYEEPTHKHGWVSTPEDIRTDMPNRRVVFAEERLPWIEEQVRGYVEKHDPTYVRLLCNCLQPERIPERHAMLTAMANRINPAIVFSQNKPPRQPRQPCAKIYPHPCLNADGWVYPCDSVVLNKTAGHRFNSAWRVCRWDEVGELYSNPVRKVIPNNICPGCVFADQVDLIGDIIDGMDTPVPEGPEPAHLAFV